MKKFLKQYLGLLAAIGLASGSLFAFNISTSIDNALQVIKTIWVTTDGTTNSAPFMTMDGSGKYVSIGTTWSSYTLNVSWGMFTEDHEVGLFVGKDAGAALGYPIPTTFMGIDASDSSGSKAMITTYDTRTIGNDGKVGINIETDSHIGVSGSESLAYLNSSDGDNLDLSVEKGIDKTHYNFNTNTGYATSHGKSSLDIEYNDMMLSVQTGLTYTNSGGDLWHEYTYGSNIDLSPTHLHIYGSGWFANMYFDSVLWLFGLGTNTPKNTLDIAGGYLTGTLGLRFSGRTWHAGQILGLNNSGDVVLLWHISGLGGGTTGATGPQGPQGATGADGVGTPQTLLLSGDVIYISSGNTVDLSTLWFWSLLWNSLTDPTRHFIGTTDMQDLVFKTNNMERMRITGTGNIGIGTDNPVETLDLSGTAVTTFINQYGTFSLAANNTIFGGNPGVGGTATSGGELVYAWVDHDGIKLSAELAYASGAESQFITVSQFGPAMFWQSVLPSLHRNGIEVTTTGVRALLMDPFFWSGAFTWEIDSSSTELMRLTNAGYLGIGVIDPLYSLDVGGMMRVWNIPTGSTSNNVLVESGGVVKKISPSLLGNLKQATLVLGPSDLATMNSVKTIVCPTDPNNYIELSSVVFEYDHAGTDYVGAGGSLFTFLIGRTVSSDVSLTYSVVGILGNNDQISSSSSFHQGETTVGACLQVVGNTALTTGNGTLRIKASYIEHTFGQ